MIRDFKRLSLQRIVMIKWYDEYKLVSFNLLNYTSMNVFGELLYTRQTGLAVSISLSVIVCQLPICAPPTDYKLHGDRDHICFFPFAPTVV